MKKSIFILTVIVMFVISCISTTMASFSISEMEMRMNMQHEQMNLPSCLDAMDLDDSNNECCYSPFPDSNIKWNISSNNGNKKNKLKVISIDFLALLQESLKYNYVIKLTSPPDRTVSEKEDNLYVKLTGIIKNNC